MTTENTLPDGPDPGKLPFPLQDGERVLKLFRRHWMYLWPRTALWTAIAILPPAILYWLTERFFDLDGNVRTVFVGIAILWFLFWAVRTFLNWYQYDNDLWVITNQRIVDSLKPTPFNMKLSSADLVNIQDITVERRGIFQTTLNFGDVNCQTAADNRDFTITGVPNPQAVQLLIDKERDRERMRTH